MQLSDFKAKVRYKFIGRSPLATPNGLLDNKHPHSYTGSEWKNILVYDFSPHSTPPFEKMFKVVKK